MLHVNEITSDALGSQGYYMSNNELDTHADTCTFGPNVLLISQELGQEAVV